MTKIVVWLVLGISSLLLMGCSSVINNANEGESSVKPELIFEGKVKCSLAEEMAQKTSGEYGNITDCRYPEFLRFTPEKLLYGEYPKDWPKVKLNSEYRLNAQESVQSRLFCFVGARNSAIFPRAHLECQAGTETLRFSDMNISEGDTIRILSFSYGSNRIDASYYEVVSE